MELWTLIVVGLGIDRWCNHELVTTEERAEFWEAVTAAGMELALAPQVVNVDQVGVAAKMAAQAQSRAADSGVAGDGDDARAERAVRAKLARAGVAQSLIEAHIRRQRAAAARARGGDAGAVGAVRGSEAPGQGDRRGPRARKGP